MITMIDILLSISIILIIAERIYFNTKYTELERSKMALTKEILKSIALLTGVWLKLERDKLDNK